jgi:polysaccharide pyruvyl transferase WcaK-like protein
LAYSDKFLGVFQSAGVGHAIIDLRKADTAEVLEEVASAWEGRHELRGDLQTQMPILRKSVNETVKRMLSADARST